MPIATQSEGVVRPKQEDEVVEIRGKVKARTKAFMSRWYHAEKRPGRSGPMQGEQIDRAMEFFEKHHPFLGTPSNGKK